MALLDASRQAWLTVPGGSRHDIESSGSSASLLHSIYGSQASQLPISDYGSETSWGKSHTDLAGAKSFTSLPRRTGRSRPMSSPASVLAARQAQRKVLSSVLIESPSPGGSQASLEEREKSAVAYRQPPAAEIVPRKLARPYSAAVSSSSSRNPLRPSSAWGPSRPPQAARTPNARLLSRPQSAAVSRSSSISLLPQCQRSRPPSTTTFHRKTARPKTALATTVRIVYLT